MMNLLWYDGNHLSESDEKSDKKPPMNKFQLKTYLFNVLYPNMDNLFNIWLQWELNHQPLDL